MTEEHEEWLNDTQAQEEYRKWKIEDEMKRARLPDPFTTEPDAFLKAFHEIFGAKK